MPLKVISQATFVPSFMTLKQIETEKWAKNYENAIFAIFKPTLWPWAKVKVNEGHMLLKVSPQTALVPSFITLLQLVSEIFAC